MPEISVIICTHNPRKDYLQRTLDALRAQTLATEQWELLLIDNASKEPVASVWNLSWHPHARHVREDEVGVTHARLRGIAEFVAPLLVFIDDDNILAPDYLERALQIAEKYPQLGVFGAGWLEPEFEIPPPGEILPHVGMLALRKVSQELWSNNPRDASCLPWGAGLCSTRKTAIHFHRLVEQMNIGNIIGRSGSRLTSGEDDLFAWASVQTGHGFGIFPELQITHLISAGRLNRNYFLRFVEGHQFSHGIMDYLLTGKKPRRQGLIPRLRIRLNGIRAGSFARAWQLAEGRGANRAADFIDQRRLTPITPGTVCMPAAALNQ